MSNFTEDDIKRTGLPADVFVLLHDLCYHVNNNLRGNMDELAVRNYVRRAQQVLKAQDIPVSSGVIALVRLIKAIEEMKPFVSSDKHIPWNNVLHWADKLSGKSCSKT